MSSPDYGYLIYLKRTIFLPIFTNLCTSIRVKKLNERGKFGKKFNLKALDFRFLAINDNLNMFHFIMGPVYSCMTCTYNRTQHGVSMKVTRSGKSMCKFLYER